MTTTIIGDNPGPAAGFAPPGPVIHCNPAEAADELIDLITAQIRRHPRSLQTTIGPSEIGSPCDRKLGHKLAGTPQKADSSWLTTVGTAVHTWLEHAFTDTDPADYASFVHAWANRLNHTGPDLLGEHPRFYTESHLPVAQVAGQTITGHSDLYDRLTASPGTTKS